MCMEDVRIARESGANVSVVPVSAADTIVATYDPHRTCLLISETQGVLVWVMPGQQAGNNSGFPLIAAYPGLRLTLQEHGQLVCQEWHCFASGATTVVVAISSLQKD